jgi:hypothetical protein
MALVIMPLRCLRHSNIAPRALPVPRSDTPNDAVLLGTLQLHVVDMVLQVLADTGQVVGDGNAMAQKA